MSAELQIDDQDRQLLKSILLQIDELATAELESEHLDEETMALFVAGGLNDGERKATIHHLAECPACRAAASLLLHHDETMPAYKRDEQHRESGGRSAVLVVAIAASVLILVGLIFLLPDRTENNLVVEQKYYEQAHKLVLAGKFSLAQKVLAEAEAQGLLSDRLASLGAQSVRKIPEPIALAYAGRLSDFGYDIGGVVARSPGTGEHQDVLQEAHNLLAAADSTHLEVLLNRGHVLLSLDRTDEAVTEFKTATIRFPNEALAWLGQGLALFMAEDFAGAESAFFEAARLDSQNVATQINLAMTLEEQDEFAKAITIWRNLLNRNITRTDREIIQLQLEQLQQQQHEQSQP